MKDFYKTVQMDRKELSERKEKAKSQQETVLNFFKKHPGSYFTPFEIWDYVFEKRCPVTSVRRSMTNLEKAGYLIKTKEYKEGDYGMKNHTWRFLPPNEPKQLSFFDA